MFELLLHPSRSTDDVIDRRPLYSAVLRHGGRDQRRLLLVQLARDAVYLDENDIADILKLLSPGKDVYTYIYEHDFTSVLKLLSLGRTFGLGDPDEVAMVSVALELNRAARYAHSPREIVTALRENLTQTDLLSLLAAFLGVGSLS